MEYRKEGKEGRFLNIIGIILSIIVFMSIFLTYPYNEDIKQSLVLWLIASFYIPVLLGIVGHAVGDKILGKAVIILGLFLINFFIGSLISIVFF